MWFDIKTQHDSILLKPEVLYSGLTAPNTRLWAQAALIRLKFSNYGRSYSCANDWSFIVHYYTVPFNQLRDHPANIQSIATDRHLSTLTIAILAGWYQRRTNRLSMIGSHFIISLVPSKGEFLRLDTKHEVNRTSVGVPQHVHYSVAVLSRC